MHSELIRFETKDKLELQGLLYEPKQETIKVTIHIHGWVGNFYENLFIDSIAKFALQKNIAFFTFNNRGAGIVTEFVRNNKREKIGGSLEIFEESILDIGAIDIVLIMGNHQGVQHFILKKITPLGINTVEDQPDFKKKFGFEVNLGLLKFSWGTSEK